MLSCYTKTQKKKGLPIYLLTEEGLPGWLTEQPLQVRRWVESLNFMATPGEFCLLSDASGNLSGVLLGAKDENDVWQLGALPLQLPQNTYYLASTLKGHLLHQALIAWGMGAYQFTAYKKAEREAAQLFLPPDCHVDLVINVVESIYTVRDLVNTPPEDMGPLELAEEVVELGKQYNAVVTQIISEELLDEMYPAIFMVGRASYNSPRLIDLQWGDSQAPKLTLVGKGVCFDTGGLDMKSIKGMALMKLDMGGAAHALGLARMIMQANLPVRLRVLIPAVENSISGDAYHPSDVSTMRTGKTVEVTNTDAEGRLILADTLVEASSEKPDLLIDFATLTGAAKVALGPDLPAMFTNNDVLAKHIIAFANQNNDPVWRMPIYDEYLPYLDSNIADLSNCSSVPYGGSITATLFLKQFVDQDIPWLHFDIMAWNLEDRPAHPAGGEAVALRAVFDYLRQRFSSQH